MHSPCGPTTKTRNPRNHEKEWSLSQSKIVFFVFLRVFVFSWSRWIMFSLHVDTARSWRGGQNQVLLTVNGLRAIGQRATLVAHPDGELRKRAAEGLDLIPLAPRTEMDLSAAWKFSRLIKRFAPDIIHARS